MITIKYISESKVLFTGVFKNEEVAQANLLEYLSDEYTNYMWWIDGNKVFHKEIDEFGGIKNSDKVNTGYITIEDSKIETIEI